MKKIFTIIGTRPQFIKAAVISRALKNYDNITEEIIHTGQHFDTELSSIFFEELSIQKPQINLGIGSGNHGFQTGRMIEQIELLLFAQKPDEVLVYGDTNSTLAGALAAVKLHIPVVHIEAGLRSFNRKMPEEINRILTDHCSSLLFAPTKTAVKNLMLEGISKKQVFLVGDVMYDAAIIYAKKAKEISSILLKHNLFEKKYILVTIHRAENTNNRDRLSNIVEGLSNIAYEMPIILPLHPRTRQALEQFNLMDKLNKKVNLIDPVGYLDMIMLEKHAALIATDSGGVQKEAYFFRVPCVTLRDETEWVELVESGWNHLCTPTSAEVIRNVVIDNINNSGEATNLYGDGNAAMKIAEHLMEVKLGI